MAIPTTFRFEDGKFVPHDEQLYDGGDERAEEIYFATLKRWGFSAEEDTHVIYGGELGSIQLVMIPAVDIRRPEQEFAFLAEIGIARSFHRVLCRTLSDALDLLNYMTPILHLNISNTFNCKQ